MASLRLKLLALLLVSRTALAAEDAGGTSASRSGASECESDAASALQFTRRGLDRGAATLPPASKWCPFLPKHQPLREPPVVRSPVTLHVRPMLVCDVGYGGTQWWYTRAYALPGREPSIPGPTIHTKPGERLNITIVNDLAPPSPDCGETRRTNKPIFGNTVAFCLCNTTNLHVHGLHVTPRPGGDDVFKMVEPQSTGSVVVDLPPNHASGTFIYHPHTHHSTSSQMGGGMHGALVIEDPPNKVPEEIADMPTQILVLSLVDMRLYTSLTGAASPSIERRSRGNLWKNQRGHYVHRMFTLYLLVNGMWKPSLEMVGGRWMRLNLIFATVELDMIVKAIPSSSESAGNGFYCEFQLLAKDGMYLGVAPRLTEKLYLASANRVDVAVRCGCKTYRGGLCEGSFWSLPDSRSSGGTELGSEMQDGAPETSGSGPFEGIGQRTLRQEFLFIRVRAPQAPPSPPLRRFRVDQPCYLADLRKVKVLPENQGVISLPAPFLPTYPQWQVVYWSNVTTPEQYQGQPMAHINNHPALRNMSIGTVQELRFNGPPSKAWNRAYVIGGIRDHPIHMHLTPFQIVRLRCSNGTWIDEGSCDSSTFFEVGDWHDTLMHSGGQAVVRFQLSTFTGRMVLHCHILAHEDEGMMAYFNITGREGTRWQGAKRADPNCYYGHYQGHFRWA